MEKIEASLSKKISDGDGYGNGYGYGYGDGSGYGDGDGHGDGSGYGNGSGYGSGYGYGDGYGSGDGSGDGSGSGSGYGSGDGSGDGSGYGYDYDIKAIAVKGKLMPVYMIDETATVISARKGNYAKGYILQKDLTLTPCYVAKEGESFAHGKTLREAVSALSEKLLEKMPVEERIRAFSAEFKPGKRYSGRDFYSWHHVLTGSCELGRNAFIKDGGYDIDGEYTVKEFIGICRNAYGGEIIKRLEEAYK